MPMKNPPHPGRSIKDACLNPLGLTITDGQQIRCRANLDFYAPFGKLQLVVREVDAAFGEGQLAARRRQTLEALAAAGLLELNKAHVVPELPLKLALITSEGSAAYHDFLTTLSESPFGFRVLFVHAAVQGEAAERQLVSALATAARARPDVTVMIRGGGSRSDLAVFDSRRLAEAIARSDFPVVTGLGHEIDESVADVVACVALKTPTKVAEYLVQRMGAADARLLDLRRRLGRSARLPLLQGQAALGRVEEGLKRFSAPLRSARERLGVSSSRLVLAVRRLVEGGRRQVAVTQGHLAVRSRRLMSVRRGEPDRVGRSLVALARARLGETQARLDGWAGMCRQLAPVRTLERGFTITRDPDGQALRKPEQAPPGSPIVTVFASGEVRSRVEES